MAEKMRTGAMVLNSDRGAAAEVFLSHDSARAIEAVCLLIVDPFDLEMLMQVIPRSCFVGVHRRPFRDASASE